MQNTGDTYKAFSASAGQLDATGLIQRREYIQMREILLLIGWDHSPRNSGGQ